LQIDGIRVGSERGHLDRPQQLTELGRVALRPGTHSVTLRYSEGGFPPGSSGTPFAMGPIVLSQAEAPGATVELEEPSEAASLCGRELDWIEALPGPA
jgi:hypothetical protein